MRALTCVLAVSIMTSPEAFAETQDGTCLDEMHKRLHGNEDDGELITMMDMSMLQSHLKFATRETATHRIEQKVVEQTVAEKKVVMASTATTNFVDRSFNRYSYKNTNHDKSTNHTHDDSSATAPSLAKPKHNRTIKTELLDPVLKPTRVVFSLTTTKSRIDKVKPALDSIMKQTRPADVVYLSIPPDVSQVPQWLQEMLRSNSSLKLLHMKEDYGPASKLLAALREGSENEASTVVIYGDDDMLYGPRIIELHLEAQSGINEPTAYGTRRIAIGKEGSKQWEQLLEAVGSVSVRASYLTDDMVFSISETPDACLLSDDYWISHFLSKAKVRLELLPTCQYDFESGIWPDSCSRPFQTIPEVQHIQALSETKLSQNGHGERSGGAWQDQLARYSRCQSMLIRRTSISNDM